MNAIIKWSGVVALVILAIMGVSKWLSAPSSQSFGTACTDITCLQGGLRLTSGPLEVSSGDFSMTGNQTITGNLSVSGTSALVGSTTLSAGFKMVKAPSCMEFFATSTATKVNMTFAATSTASAFGVGGVIPVMGYGACN